MKHGTFAGYDYHGCRCDECRRFIAAYRAHQRGGFIVTVYPEGIPSDLRAFLRHTSGRSGHRVNYEFTPKGRAYLRAMKKEQEVA